jgi:hypothetical protein
MIPECEWLPSNSFGEAGIGQAGPASLRSVEREDRARVEMVRRQSRLEQEVPRAERREARMEGDGEVGAAVAIGVALDPAVAASVEGPELPRRAAERG